MFAAGAAVGLALGIPGGAWLVTDGEAPVPSYRVAPPTVATYAAPLEDEPGWDCRSGDGVCGPLGDDAGHAPGCYDDAGTLVAPWPCHAIGDIADPGTPAVFCADIIALTGCEAVRPA